MTRVNKDSSGQKTTRRIKGGRREEIKKKKKAFFVECVHTHVPVFSTYHNLIVRARKNNSFVVHISLIHSNLKDNGSVT